MVAMDTAGLVASASAPTSGARRAPDERNTSSRLITRPRYSRGVWVSRRPLFADLNEVCDPPANISRGMARRNSQGALGSSPRAPIPSMAPPFRKPVVSSSLPRCTPGPSEATMRPPSKAPRPAQLKSVP